jgi:maleate cis-trans isomerase
LLPQLCGGLVVGGSEGGKFRRGILLFGGQRFATPKVLLLTPFVESMNKLIRDYLAACGVEAISPADTFDDYRDAMTVEPDDVYALTEKAFKANPDGLFFFDAGLFERAAGVEAIYFQGAVLDPLKILDRLEQNLSRPVVASNPAMLWFMLARVGFSCSISGYGKLLRDWPGIKA